MDEKLGKVYGWDPRSLEKMKWRWNFVAGTPVAGFSEEAGKGDERVNSSEMKEEMD